MVHYSEIPLFYFLSFLIIEPLLYLFRQFIQIYGEAVFSRVYDYLRTARYSSPAADEKAIMVGLRRIVPNTRDCFLVDQIVFLEKQAEVVASMNNPHYSQR